MFVHVLCKLSTWSREKATEQPRTIRGRTKSLRSSPTFIFPLYFCYSFSSIFFLNSLVVSGWVSIVFIFSFSIFYFLCHPFPVSIRPSFFLSYQPPTLSHFFSFLLSLSVTYTSGSVIVLEPPQTWDGYISVLCVFSISPTVAIFFPHRLSVDHVPQPCWSSHLHHPAPKGLFRSPINHFSLAD